MTDHPRFQPSIYSPNPAVLVSHPSEVMRLATLVAAAFEAGSRKAERDVLDEICKDYGLSLDKVEQTATRSLAATLLPFHRTQLVRTAVSSALAEKAGTVEDLASTVFRRTRGFIAMLDDIYRCLARAEATTNGNSETFRLRVAEVQIGIELSPAFFERVRSIVRTLTTVEIGSIDNDKLSRFLGVDGDFYGSWPLKSNTAINVARQLTYLPWLFSILQNRSSFAAQRGTLHGAIDSCKLAATTFVTSALRLVRAYVALLQDEAAEAENKTEPDILERNNDARDERTVLIDRGLLRQHGVLRGGLRSRTMGLRINGNERTHVLIDNLLSTTDAIGIAPDCMVALGPDVLPNFSGSSVGALACLCGLWKAGIQREPQSDSEVPGLLAGDPDGITAWLARLETSLRGASDWLAGEVWTPTGTAERVDLVEVFDDYLRLPLWRHRWLIYEIWLISLTLDAVERAGWQYRLALTNGDSIAKIWELPKGPASLPCATVKLPGLEGSDLHLWYQGRWRRAGVDMMPDVALTTVQPPIHDIVLVEGKDRYRMPIKSLRDGALEVGRKYSEASGAAFTWIVNYCPFSTAEGVGATINHGNPWRALFLTPEVRPGHVPQNFFDSIATALQPWAQRVNNIKARTTNLRTLVFVCDTTGSMKQHLQDFWQSMRHVLLLRGGKSRFAAFRALLFSDHDPGQTEPYLIRHVGPALHPGWVIDQALREPGTDGGDISEALEDAIKACRDVAGRLGEPICCIVATDAPPHAPADCPNKIDFRAEMDGFLRDGNVCIVVMNWLDSSTALTWKAYEAHPRFFRADLDNKEQLLNIMESVGLLVT